MGGKKMLKTVDDYINSVAQRTAAGEGLVRELDERRRVAGLVQNLRNQLRLGCHTPVVGQYFDGGEQVYVVGCIDENILSVDDSGRLGVSMKPGNVVVDGGDPEYRKGRTFIPIGKGPITLGGSHGTHVQVRHGGRPTTTIYVGGDALEAAMRLDLGYKGELPKSVTPALTKRLNTDR